MEINRKRVAKRLASGLLAGALALGGLAISGASPASAITPVTTSKRVEGADRYATSVALANQYFVASSSTADVIVVASGENYPDALAAASLAGQKDGPVILVPSSGDLPQSVRDFFLLNRAALGAATAQIYVVGGTSAVSDGILDQIKAVANTAGDTTPITYTRVAGADRYATAAAINAVSGVVDSNDNIILVSGESFADAVSAAAIAFEKDFPIVLTAPGSLSASALATISAGLTANPTAKIVIVGGKSAVSEQVEVNLVNAGVPYASIVRVAGADRYATNLAVNSAMVAALSPANPLNSAVANTTKMALVTGENFADALAAAPFLGHAGIHPVLTNSASLNPNAAGLIATVSADGGGSPTELYAIGGTSAVSAAAVSAGVAAAKTDMIGTVTCAEGSNKLTVVFPDSLTAGEATALNARTVSLTTGAVANAGTGTRSTTAVANDTMTIDLSATLTAGVTVSVQSVTENVAGGLNRSLSMTSCTVADDATGPVATIAYPASGNPNANVDLVITFDEPVKYNEAAGAAAGALDGGDITDDMATPGTYTINALDNAAASGYAKVFQVTASAAVTSGKTVTVGAGAAGPADLALNPMAAAKTFTMGDTSVATNVDAAAPTFTAVTTCVAAGTAPATATPLGGLTLTSLTNTTANNGWKFTIVNVRGQVLPSIAVDATAKVVTISADTRYTSDEDVAQYAANNASLPGWTLAASGAGNGLTAVTSGTSSVLTSGATRACSVVVTASEFLDQSTLLTVNIAVTINGLAANHTGFTKGLDGKSFSFSLPAAAVDTTGAAVVGVGAAAIKDLAGNSMAVPFTA